jgi:hypothetical protein
LKQTTIWLHDGHMKLLTKLAKIKGLKTAQLVRLAVAEYLKRHGHDEL